MKQIIIVCAVLVPGTLLRLRIRRHLDIPRGEAEPRAAWLLNAAKAREYDYLVGMDAYNIADLRRLVYSEDLPKIHKLLDFAGKPRDIADPWYTGNFDATYDDILEGCTAMLATLSALDGQNLKGCRCGSTSWR